MKYAIGRRVIRGLLALFFRRIMHAGAPVVSDGPVLIVANHPNQVLDPLLLVHLWHRPIYFLAKSTLFQGLLGVVVRRLNMLPIYRRHENSDMSQNAATFQVVSEKLRAHGAVAIFPEGTSIGEPRILPMKTGAARIVLQTLEEGGIESSLALQAVGITYGDMYRFRSSVTLTVTAPLRLSRAKYLDKLQSPEAVRELTETIDQYIRSATIDLPDEEVRELTNAISWLYEGLSPVDDRDRIGRVLQNVLVHQDAALRRSVLDEVLALRESFAALGLHGDETATKDVTLGALFAMLLSLSGALVFYPPYWMTGKVVQAKAREPVYLATMKLGYGMLLYGFWIAVLALILFLSFPFRIAFITLIALVALGAFAIRNVARGWMVFSSLWPPRTRQLEVLCNRRANLHRQLEALRVDSRDSLPR